ncbi:MAG: hypothetical protein A3F10_05445 [Coxiella sp. RIFCSPHIGHO2_12_FULL_42_15]|nr:MAG: hypothetical protein A3F10_05445 [Coxiella sp. RIFCSPHIGHO2_12_FULL_42_15]
MKNNVLTFFNGRNPVAHSPKIFAQQSTELADTIERNDATDLLNIVIPPILSIFSNPKHSAKNVVPLTHPLKLTDSKSMS